MRRLFIIGGTGQIGRAVADRFAREGWQVTLAARNAAPQESRRRTVALDRSRPGALDAVLGEGVDLLLDCVGFDAADAAQLIDVQDRVGRIVTISSASVYRDARGRTLDEARQTGFPNFPVPIPEDHPTVAPGRQTYSTRKVAMEQTLLTRAKTPVTILRPCAIHGPHSKHAREWWVVKRLLDGRRRIPLAYGGRSQFQTTSTRATANAVWQAALGTAPQIANVIDGDAPSTAEIAQTILRVMDLDAELVGLPDAPFPPAVGMTPWSVAAPLVCDSSLPVQPPYADTAPDAINWLVEATRDRDWQTVLPQLAAYPRALFDYDAEDAALAAF